MDLASLTTPSLLWARHSAARDAARLAEAAHRSDAFFDDVAPVVCGVPVRILRPDDLLVLDRLGNPFITGGPRAGITLTHVNQFLWLLAVVNVPGLLNGIRLRGFLHLRGKDPAPLPAQIAEVEDYINAVFQDAPATGAPRDQTASHRAPLGAHFLASLLVPLACDVGPADPLDGRPWQLTPLPRIFQYLKVAAARKDAEFADAAPSSDFEAAWLAEVNAARAAGLLVGEQGIPGSRGLDHLTAAEIHAAHGLN